MVLDYILDNWNNALTLITFAVTATLAFYQIRHYRNQPASLEIDAITDAECHDFENYTKYDLTVRLRNDGRDPASIPAGGLEINGEAIEVNTHEIEGRAGLPAHEFQKIRLDGKEYDDFALHGIGDSVSTTDALSGVFWLDSSIGRVETDVTFDRAP